MTDRLFQKDLTLKLVSLGLAILLWFEAAAALGPALPQPFREIPVDLRNLAEGLVVLSSPPPTVALHVRGRTETLRHLSKDSFTAYVDLRGANVGLGTFDVAFEAPEEVTVVQVEPPQVQIDVDALDNRQVPVAVWTRGSPAADHAMTAHIARPTDLYVEGPRSKVQMVTRVVAQVDISGATEDISRTVVVRPINAEGAEVDGVTVTPSAVDVQVAIVMLPPARDIQVRANVQGRPAAGYVQESVTVNPPSVKLWAQGQVADELRYLWTHPIEVEGATETIQREVLLLVPPEVEKVEPTLVRVTVEIVEAYEERLFSGLAVEPFGLGPGLRATLEPAQVDVLVRGLRSQVAALEAADIVCRVDLAELVAGTHQARVVISLPEGLSAKAVTPNEVKVVLETE